MQYLVLVLHDETKDDAGYIWIYTTIEGVLGWSRSYPINPNTRDFVESPIVAAELASNSVTKAKIVPGAVDKSNVASDITTSLNRADTSVQLSGNQTINGTKTFGTRPVVPSSTDAVSLSITDRSPTEAQVFNSIRASNDELKGMVDAETERSKSVEALKVNISDIINHLTSTNANVPLAAAQGKALSDLIGLRQEAIPGTGEVQNVVITPIETGEPLRTIALRDIMKSPVATIAATPQVLLNATVKGEAPVVKALADFELTERKTDAAILRNSTVTAGEYPSTKSIKESIRSLDLNAEGDFNVAVINPAERHQAVQIARGNGTSNTEIPRFKAREIMNVIVSPPRTNRVPSDFEMQLDRESHEGANTYSVFAFGMREDDTKQITPIGGPGWSRRNIVAKDKNEAKTFSEMYPNAIVYYPDPL